MCAFVEQYSEKKAQEAQPNDLVEQEQQMAMGCVEERDSYGHLEMVQEEPFDFEEHYRRESLSQDVFTGSHLPCLEVGHPPKKQRFAGPEDHMFRVRVRNYRRGPLLGEHSVINIKPQGPEYYSQDAQIVPSTSLLSRITAKPLLNSAFQTHVMSQTQDLAGLGEGNFQVLEEVDQLTFEQLKSELTKFGVKTNGQTIGRLKRHLTEVIQYHRQGAIPNYLTN